MITPCMHPLTQLVENKIGKPVLAAAVAKRVPDAEETEVGADRARRGLRFVRKILRKPYDRNAQTDRHS